MKKTLHITFALVIMLLVLVVVACGSEAYESLGYGYESMDYDVEKYLPDCYDNQDEVKLEEGSEERDTTLTIC
jgi:hypothetical protein